MVLSVPWADSLDIIAFQTEIKLIGINPMGLSVPKADYLVVIALHTVKEITID